MSTTDPTGTSGPADRPDPAVDPLHAAEAAQEWGRILAESERIRHAVAQIALAGRADPWASAAATIGIGRPVTDDDEAGTDGTDPAVERERDLVELLGGLRRSMLSTPIVAQSVFAHLVAEGRAYAATDDGAAMAAAMRADPALERLRQLWEVTSLNVLDETPRPVPPAWVNLIRDLVHGDLVQRTVDRLRPGDEP